MSFILLGILNSQATAAGGGSAFDLLETQILGSSASAVEFTGLSSYASAGYKHLQLRLTVRETGSNTGYGEASIQFNGNTSTIYAMYSIYAYPSLLNSSEVSKTKINTVLVPGGGSTANRYGSSIIDILDFADATHHKPVITRSGVYVGAQEVRFSGGNFRSTSAITSITVNAYGTSYAAGSRFSLYGLKG